MSLFQSISGFISSASSAIVGPETTIGSLTSSGTSFADVMNSAINAVQPALSGQTNAPAGSVSAFSNTIRSRNSSTSSSTPMTSSGQSRAAPGGPDLSHLSAEEQRQIEAVLARAASQSAAGKDTSPALNGDAEKSASVRPVIPPMTSNAGYVSTTCAVCSERVQMRRTCKECQRTVCQRCSVQTAVMPGSNMDWLCSVCDKRRQLASATSRLQQQQQQADLDHKQRDEFLRQQQLREHQERERSVKEQEIREQEKLQKFRDQEELERRQREALLRQQQIKEQEEIERRQREELLRQQQIREQEEMERRQREELLRQQREEFLRQQKIREQEEIERRQKEELLRQQKIKEQQETERRQKEELLRQQQIREQEEIERRQREELLRQQQIKEQEELERRQKEEFLRQQQIREQEERQQRIREQEEIERKQREELLRQQRIREQEEMERKQKEELLRQQRIREQEEMERRQREELLRQQKIREQEEMERRQREELLRQQKIREEEEIERRQREELLRQQRIREQEEIERKQREELLRQQQIREQEERERRQRELLRQQQIREQEEIELKQKELARQQKIREQEEIERRQREELLRQQKIREQEELERRQREELLRQQRIREQEERERKQKEELLRQQKLKEQEEMERRQREELLRQQQLREQQEKERAIKEREIREQQERQRKIMEQEEIERRKREEQSKQQLLKEHQEKERLMKEREIKEQQERQQKVREQEETERRQKEHLFREQQQQERNFIEQFQQELQHREQQFKEQQQRDFQQIQLRQQRWENRELKETTDREKSDHCQQKQQQQNEPQRDANIIGNSNQTISLANSQNNTAMSQQRVDQHWGKEDRNYQNQRNSAADNYDSHLVKVGDQAPSYSSVSQHTVQSTSSHISAIRRQASLPYSSVAETNDQITIENVPYQQSAADEYDCDYNEFAGQMQPLPEEYADDRNAANFVNSRPHQLHLNKSAPGEEDVLVLVATSSSSPEYLSKTSDNHYSVDSHMTSSSFDCRSRVHAANEEPGEIIARKRTIVSQRPGHHDQRSMPQSSNSTQSPSRRSPKSPPCSPSWMRHHRESSPQGHRLISPSLSPTERLHESASGSRSQASDKAGVEEYEIRLDGGDEFEVNTTGDLSVPMKPARAGVDGFRLSSSGNPVIPDADFGVLNIASFAAAVANDTAHLTRRSVSPMDLNSVNQTIETTSEMLSTTNGRLFREPIRNTLETSDPTPKVIDHQNSRRQKAKSPGSTADWSPVSDLSPIMDVSPSGEHRTPSTSGLRSASSANLDSRRALPNTPALRTTTRPADSMSKTSEDRRTTNGQMKGNTESEMYQVCVEGSTGSVEDEMMIKSSLKRCPRFEDITSINSSVDRSGVSQTAVSCITSGKSFNTSNNQSRDTSNRATISDGHVYVEKATQGTQSTMTDPFPANEVFVKNQNPSEQINDSQFSSNAKRNLTSADTSTDNSTSIALRGGTGSPAGLRSEPESNGTGSVVRTPSSVESPSSSTESTTRKQRRRLPPVPVNLEPPFTASNARRLRSRSADSRVLTESNGEKERLRRHLRLREVERRRSFESDDNDQAAFSGDERSQDQGHRSRADSTPRHRKLPDVETASQGITTKTAVKNSVFSTRKPLEKLAQKTASKKLPRRVELVNFRGVLVPTEVKVLKQRIKEELQIATASRRLELDESEEVRRMELALAEKERQQRIKIQRETRDEVWQREQIKQSEADRLELEKLIKKRQNAIIKAAGKYQQDSLRGMSSRSTGLSSSSKHRRQTSDPMKFSSKDEDLELENWLRRYGLTETNIGESLSPPWVSSSNTLKKLRRGTSGKKNASKRWDTSEEERGIFGGTLPLPTKSDRDLQSSYTLQNHKSFSRSTEMLAKLSMLQKHANLSHSESSLPLTALTSLTSQTATYFSDGDDGGISDARVREERKLQLQMEIGLRKLQLEETQYLQNELRKLAEMPDITTVDMDKARSLYQQRIKMRDQVPTGIIKPLDSGFPAEFLLSGGNMEPLVVRGSRRTDLIEPKVRLIPGVPSLGYASHQKSLKKPNQHSSRVNEILYGRGGSHASYTDDHSPGDSDENIMEGGVTIQRRKKTKLMQTEQGSRHHYDFPTKRILLTRDPKDKSRHGNGFGIKIVGGKIISEKSNEVGAFVTAIQRGGIADQLHGEVQEGDQVLEWNGIVLTGKTFEEVQRISSQPNGEIELVIRPRLVNASAKHSSTMSTLHTDSCLSSFDQLDAPSDSDEYHAGRPRLDPTKARNYRVISPAVSQSSSQQDLRTGSSMSTSGSSEPVDLMSPVAEKNVLPSARNTRNQGDQGVEYEAGEIQVQLSYDTYDGTLNVHIIQARRLLPRETNSYCDPYVKVYLLPGRSVENKRRTRYIPRTLDPEWHQTMVFMCIPRTELPNKSLELTIWDFDRYKPNNFLGEVTLSLSDTRCLDNRPHWYRLVRGNQPRAGSVTPTNRAFPSQPEPDKGPGNRGSGGHGGNGGDASHRRIDQHGAPKDSSRDHRSTGNHRHRKNDDFREDGSLSHKSSSESVLNVPAVAPTVSKSLLTVHVKPVQNDSLLQKVLTGSFNILFNAFSCCHRPMLPTVDVLLKTCKYDEMVHVNNIKNNNNNNNGPLLPAC